LIECDCSKWFFHAYTCFLFFDIKSLQLAKEDVDDIELAILPAPCQACQDDSFESMDFVARAFQQAREMAEIALGKK